MRTTSIFASLLAAVFLLTTAAHTADAGGTKKKKAAPVAKVNEKALSELMSAFKFGMSRKQVIKVVTKQVNERYAEKITDTNDTYKQDAFRNKAKKEVKRFKKSRVKFNGKKSGWDVSIIEDEFGHNNDESMLVLWENQDGKNQRRFFFFHEDHLYKMAIQLDATQLDEDQRTFEFFTKIMQKRFGDGTVTEVGMAWKAGTTKLDAYYKMAMHAALLLVISDTQQSAAVLTARAEHNPSNDQSSNIMDSIMEKEGDEGPSLDRGADVIDRITKEK